MVRKSLGRSLPPLRAIPIADIRPSDLVTIDEAIEWPPSRKTRKNAIGALRQVFSFAMHARGGKLITSNPAESLSTSDRRNVKAPPDPYSAEERDALLNWLEGNTPQHVFAYYLLAFYSGMRTSELLALTWPKYEGESVTVNAARVRRQMKRTKTERSRFVLLPDFVCKMLNTLPSRFKREWIITNQYGRPYLSAYHLNEYFQRAHDATGLRRREGPYPWRHTYASIGLTNGAKPAFLAKQLGHTLQVFFSTYAKWVEGDGDKAQLILAVGKRGQNAAARESGSLTA